MRRLPTLPGAHTLSLVKILGVPMYREHRPHIFITVDRPVHIPPKDPTRLVCRHSAVEGAVVWATLDIFAFFNSAPNDQ